MNERICPQSVLKSSGLSSMGLAWEESHLLLHFNFVSTYLGQQDERIGFLIKSLPEHSFGQLFLVVLEYGLKLYPVFRISSNSTSLPGFAS